MKYLIDTHIFMWTLMAPEKLNNSTISAMNLPNYANLEEFTIRHRFSS